MSRVFGVSFVIMVACVFPLMLRFYALQIAIIVQVILLIVEFFMIHSEVLYMVITLYDLDIKFSDFHSIALDILLFNSSIDTVDYRSFHNDCLIAFLDRSDLK